jgi:PAS domain S-box-containing protein
MVAMSVFLFLDGGIGGTGMYWIFTFPVLAFFLFDDAVGLRWNAGLLLLLSLISLAKLLGLITIPHDWVTIRQAFFSFSSVVGLLYFYTKFTAINAHIFAEKTKQLEATFKVEREKIETTAHEVEMVLKDKLGTFFQTAGDLMCMANNEYFIEINPAFTKSLGYTSEEILKTPLLEFVHEDDKEKTHQAMQKLIHGESVENFANRYRRKDGSYTWFMWNATAHDGVIYAIAHPVDGLMEAQQKLQAKLTELEKLNRLMVDRELMMIQMKKELAVLKARNQTDAQ